MLQKMIDERMQLLKDFSIDNNSNAGVLQIYIEGLSSLTAMDNKANEKRLSQRINHYIEDHRNTQVIRSTVGHTTSLLIKFIQNEISEDTKNASAIKKLYETAPVQS